MNCIFKFVLIFIAALTVQHSVQAQTTIINFDNNANWTAGSGALNSYQNNHTYVQDGWLFTGGNALRDTTGLQDGFDRVIGTYSWRLRDSNAVTWTATYTLALDSTNFFSSFGFDARRWDGTPNPSYFVEYSFDGGATFSTATLGSAGVLNNAAFDNSSDWKNFMENIISPTGLAANQFVVKFQSTNNTERIMIDNFQFTISAIPEPSTYAMILIGAICAGLAIRRMKLQKS